HRAGCSILDRNAGFPRDYLEARAGIDRVIAASRVAARHKEWQHVVRIAFEGKDEIHIPIGSLRITSPKRNVAEAPSRPSSHPSKHLHGVSDRSARSIRHL